MGKKNNNSWNIVFSYIYMYICTPSYELVCGCVSWQSSFCVLITQERLVATQPWSWGALLQAPKLCSTQAASAHPELPLPSSSCCPSWGLQGRVLWQHPHGAICTEGQRSTVSVGCCCSGAPGTSAVWGGRVTAPVCYNACLSLLPCDKALHKTNLKNCPLKHSFYFPLA